MPTKEKSTGTEITLADGKVLVVREPDTAEVANFLTGNVGIEEREESGEEIARQMVSAVFSETTAAGILGAASAVHVRDVLNRPFVIESVEWRVSAFKDEEQTVLPIYAVIHAINADGIRQTLTTGALMPCAMLYRMAQADVLSDVRVMFVKRDRPTKKGYFPINMVAADN